MWHFNENARYMRLPKMFVWGAAEMALWLRAVAALLEDPRAQWQLPNYPYFQFLKNPIIFLPFMGFRLIHIVQRCVCRQNNHEVFIMKIKEVKPQQAVAPRIQVPYCFSSSSHKDLWQTHLSNIFYKNTKLIWSRTADLNLSVSTPLEWCRMTLSQRAPKTTQNKYLRYYS